MAVFIGNSANNAIVGTNAVDTIFGLGGDDTLLGLAGNDTIDGGTGHDTMFGGTGNDTFIMDSRFDVISEFAGEGRDTILASSNVYLATSTAEIEVVQVTGTTGRQVIGNATVDQTLIGSSGNDDLRSAGVDTTLIGGGGDDLYFIDGNDTVIENASAGVDTVMFDQGSAGGAFTLGANLENLAANRLSANAVLTGNELANSITGLNADDTLFGLNGTDVLAGGAGNDTLDGGSNLDTLIGGTGDDTYIIADTTNFRIDVLTEAVGEGRDTILASRNVNLATSQSASGLPLEIEVVQVVRTTNTQVIGNETANQTLIGNIGDDDLRAVGANGTLIGGAGNDLYFTDSNDVVIELAGQGADTVLFDQASGAGNSFTLGANVENLSANNVGFSATAVLTGNAADNTITGLNAGDSLFGLGGNDVLNGNSGNDTLDGGTGVDTMSGGSGNDTYFVDAAGDLVFEAAGQGADRVNASVSFTLGAGQAIEVLQLVGAGNTDATGNELANTVNGNNGANDLFGRAGNDTLFGSGGDDFFHFAKGDGVDVIADFTGAGLAGGDVIQLGGTGLTSFAQVQALMSDLDGGTLITFNAADTLFITGIPTTQFNAGDFGFV